MEDNSKNYLQGKRGVVYWYIFGISNYTIAVKSECLTSISQLYFKGGYEGGLNFKRILDRPAGPRDLRRVICPQLLAAGGWSGLLCLLHSDTSTGLIHLRQISLLSLLQNYYTCSKNSTKPTPAKEILLNKKKVNV